MIYQSPIVFTPLKDFDTIDADKLNEIVRREYEAANVNPKDVETGAVIITGETAKKKNADEILRALSGLAGEFVVSVAGPNVESLIAGKGARYRGRGDCSPRPPNRTGGSPAYGSPVSGFYIEIGLHSHGPR